jgi:hypothetical protein
MLIGIRQIVTYYPIEVLKKDRNNEERRSLIEFLKTQYGYA